LIFKNKIQIVIQKDFESPISDYTKIVWAHDEKPKSKLFSIIQRKDRSTPTRKPDHKPETSTFFAKKFLVFGEKLEK